MELLIFAYFNINAYFTGAAFQGERIKDGWISFILFCLFGGPIVLIVWGWDKLQTVGWFIDLKFWLQLNVTGKYARLSPKKLNTIRRDMQKVRNPRVKRQWVRIQKKYGYES